MTRPISLPFSGLLPLNCTIFLFLAELSLRLRPQLFWVEGSDTGDVRLRGAETRNAQDPRMKSEIGDLEEMGWGKRESLGNVDHGMAWRVWGLLGLELHEIVTSFGHIHH
jgi:hypothetical protein